MADRELLRRIDEHLARSNERMQRGNEHMERGNELMEQIREEHRRNQAAWNASRQVLRELVLEVRESRRELRLIGNGIQASTEGLLHVLDELRRRNGPGGAATA